MSYSQPHCHYMPSEHRVVEYDPETMFTPMEIIGAVRQAGCKGEISDMELKYVYHPVIGAPSWDYYGEYIFDTDSNAPPETEWFNIYADPYRKNTGHFYIMSIVTGTLYNCDGTPVAPGLGRNVTQPPPSRK